MPYVGGQGSCWKPCWQAPKKELPGSSEGRARGLEPPNSGATSRCLNHLATPAMDLTMYQRVTPFPWLVVLPFPC